MDVRPDRACDAARHHSARLCRGDLAALSARRSTGYELCKRRSGRQGFSLLELLAVVTILGIIALVVLPRIGISTATARENACFQNKSEINRAVEQYLFDTGALPASIADLDTPTYFPDGIPNCPVSGNAYVLHPTTKRVVGHTGGGKGGGH